MRGRGRPARSAIAAKSSSSEKVRRRRAGSARRARPCSSASAWPRATSRTSTTFSPVVPTKPRISAGRDAGDHAAGRRRLAVALADRRRRVDDDRARRRARAAPPASFVRLYGTVELPGGRRVLLGRGASGHRPAGARRARVRRSRRTPLAAPRPASTLRVPSTFTRSIIGRSRVVAVERGDVNDRLAAVDRALERRRDRAGRPARPARPRPARGARGRRGCPRSRSRR